MDATDGLDVINVNMGPKYPQGMLVTQDGKDAPEGGTNFKFTPWPSVARLHGSGGRHRREPPELRQDGVSAVHVGQLVGP